LLTNAFLVLAAFFLMEPITYLAHRYIFHGFGYSIHESHHRGGATEGMYLQSCRLNAEGLAPYRSSAGSVKVERSHLSMQSHHLPRTGIFERNDFYPLISALITMSIIAAGIFIPKCTFLIPIGFGMTVYGVIYFFIHDLVIHHRARWFKVKKSWFKWHYGAHRIHHLFGGEPYGMLIPIIPAKLKRHRLNSLETFSGK